MDLDLFKLKQAVHGIIKGCLTQWSNQPKMGFRKHILGK